MDGWIYYFMVNGWKGGAYYGCDTPTNLGCPLHIAHSPTPTFAGNQ